MISRYFVVFTFFSFYLVACAAQASTFTPISNTPLPTQVSVPSATPTATVTATDIPTIMPKFDAETLAAMSPEQRLAAVPVSPDYVVGNVSTLEGKENYVIVHDPVTGVATGAWNLSTGKLETMEQAGLAIPPEVLASTDEHDFRKKITPYCVKHPEFKDEYGVGYRVLEFLKGTSILAKLQREQDSHLIYGFGPSVVDDPDGQGGCIVLGIWDSDSHKSGAYFENITDGSWVLVKFTGTP